MTANKLVSKQDVAEKLQDAGMQIKCSRKVGENCFRLISESYGHFTVNVINTTTENINKFTKQYSNITITLNF